jgi:hypothetical protein
MNNLFEKNSYSYRLTKENKQRKFTITSSISLETLEDIVVTAFECSSMAYWATLDNTGPSWKDCPDDFPCSQWAVNVLIDGDIIKLLIDDGEEKEREVSFDLQKLLEAVGKAISEYNVDLNNIDGEIADIIIQLALFDEVVYG